jgi:hypothetical protein
MRLWSFRCLRCAALQSSRGKWHLTRGERRLVYDAQKRESSLSCRGTSAWCTEVVLWALAKFLATVCTNNLEIRVTDSNKCAMGCREARIKPSVNHLGNCRYRVRHCTEWYTVGCTSLLPNCRLPKSWSRTTSHMTGHRFWHSSSTRLRSELPSTQLVFWWGYISSFSTKYASEPHNNRVLVWESHKLDVSCDVIKDAITVGTTVIKSVYLDMSEESVYPYIADWNRA